MKAFQVICGKSFLLLLLLSSLLLLLALIITKKYGLIERKTYFMSIVQSNNQFNRELLSHKPVLYQ